VNRIASCLLVVGLCGTLLGADPATTGSTSTTAKDSYLVKRGSVDASIDADGYFEATDPLEIRIRPKAYQGELIILSVAPHGSSVKAGQTILEIDPQEIDRQIAAADNELLTARANAEKAQADTDLGEQGDALAMKVQQDELKHAEDAVKWFDDVDGKQMLKTAELSVQQAKNSVSDQQDELDQLKKMYKSEELTSATADIVVKRALRNLELSKIQQTMQQGRESRVREFDFVNARQKLSLAVDQEKQQLAQLQVTQAQAKVLRQAALTTAKAALAKAEQKAAELKEDRAAMKVTAPEDGVVLFGQFTQGQWQNSNPKALRKGDKATPTQTLITFFVPGKAHFVIDVPEAKVGMLKEQMTARIVPTSLPGAPVTGTCGPSSPTGVQREMGQAFAVPVTLSSVDPRLMPGEKGAAHIDVGAVKDVLVVPVAAVQRGRVRVPGPDDKDAWKDVVCGVSNSEFMEIKSGIAEGDAIYPKAAK
jgi:multidrug efflux pump subunit AcrA (membrane-fusion protein)